MLHRIQAHNGVDFGSNRGTPIYATGDGVVEKAQRSGFNGGFGHQVLLDHGFGYKTRYAHMERVDVAVGDTVRRGDTIGTVGNTGRSSGPHLHYEVRHRGAPQNPVNYYFYDLTPEQYDQIIRMAENAGHVMD